jgi:hypothetical protein
MNFEKEIEEILSMVKGNKEWSLNYDPESSMNCFYFAVGNQTPLEKGLTNGAYARYATFGNSLEEVVQKMKTKIQTRKDLK